MNADKKHNATATFVLDGGTCMSCAYTIEHLGRKLKGVGDVFVDVRTSTIRVDYDPGEGGESLEAIPQIVRRIGYRATRVEG